MYEARPNVFAVRGYVIANTVDLVIELNPKMLVPMLGTTIMGAENAAQYFFSPDAQNRNSARA